MTIYKSFIVGLIFGVVSTLIWAFIIFTEFDALLKVIAFIIGLGFLLICQLNLVKGDRLGKFRWERTSLKNPIPAYKQNAFYVGSFIPPVISFLTYELL